MKLYHLNVRLPDAIDAAAPLDASTLVAARGTWIQVLRLTDDGIELAAERNCHISIKSVAGLPSSGPTTPLRVLVGLSSGRLITLDWTNNQLELATQQFKSPDTRGPVRGHNEYVLADSRGRAVVTLGIEAVRHIGRCDQQDESDAVDGARDDGHDNEDEDDDMDAGGVPLTDVSQPNVFCYAAESCDSPDTPAFLVLERYKFQAQKMLGLYEVNVGLNVALCRWTLGVPDDASVIVHLGGHVLVFCDRSVILVEDGAESRRAELPAGEAIVLTATKISADLALVGLSDGTLLQVGPDLVFTEVEVVDDDDDDEDEDNDNEDDNDIDKEKSGDDKLTVSSQLLSLRDGFVFGVAETGPHQAFQVTQLSPLQLARLATLPSVAPVTAATLSRRRLTLHGRRSFEVQAGVYADVLASTPLPFEPTRVFAAQSEPHAVSGGQRAAGGLIVIATPSATTVLAVGDDGAVGETGEAATGIAGDVGTLAFALVGAGHVQVHTHGFRYITQAGGVPSVQAWRPAAAAQVVAAAASPSQLALVLSSRELVYFEAADSLREQQRVRLPWATSSVCFAPTSGLRSPSVFVASAASVAEFSPALEQVRVLDMPFACSSLAARFSNAAGSPVAEVVVLAGHINGAVSECRGDEVFTCALGSAPVQLAPLNDSTIVAVSTSAWLLNENYRLLNAGGAAPLKSVHAFRTADTAGLVGITKNSLEVLDVADDPLRRDTVVARASFAAPVLQTFRLGEHSWTVTRRGVLRDGVEVLAADVYAATAVRFACEPPPPPEEEAPKPKGKKKNGKAKKNQGEAPQQPPPKPSVVESEQFVAVAAAGRIVLLRADGSASGVDTPVAGCTALLAWQGVLLAAVPSPHGNQLVAYAPGRRQLLVQYGVQLPLGGTAVKALAAAGDVVFAGDARRGVAAVRLESPGHLRVVAVDAVPRPVTRLLVLDPRTVCTGDQYGGLCVLRLPPSDLDPTADPLPTRGRGAVPTLRGVALLTLVARFTVGESIAALLRGSLTPVAGTDAVVYVGVRGAVGVLLPFAGTSEAERLARVEEHVEHALGVGRERPAAAAAAVIEPRRAVVDGDTCALLAGDAALWTEVAEIVETTPGALLHELSALRGRVTT